MNFQNGRKILTSLTFGGPRFRDCRDCDWLFSNMVLKCQNKNVVVKYVCLFSGHVLTCFVVNVLKYLWCLEISTQVLEIV